MNKLKRILRLAFSVAFVSAAIYGVLNYQALLDQYRLLGYDPPARIKQLADHTTMDDGTRRLFYANRPELIGKSNFRSHCNISEHSIVLGCYINNKGIYLLDVKDKRLDGIHEVTAAHEVLHAIYARLDGGEKEKVDRMTNDVLAKISDKRILDTVEQYRKSDASSVPDELHSILGTEVRELSAELEEYYSQYFDNRGKIVGYSEQYQAEFIKREKQRESLKSQLDSIEAEIDRLDLQLETDRASLSAQQESLESSRDSSEPEDFNRRVRQYNSDVASFNAKLSRRNAFAEEYNSLRDQYNALVYEEQALVDAIDTRQESL
jgi:hypothetical protein